MKMKFTLWLDDRLLAEAKRRSDESGRSVSELVEGYLKSLAVPPVDTGVENRVYVIGDTLPDGGIEELDGVPLLVHSLCE